MVVLQITFRIVGFHVFQGCSYRFLVSRFLIMHGLYVKVYVFVDFSGFTGFSDVIDIVNNLGRTVIFEFNHLLNRIIKHGGPIVFIIFIIVFLH